MKKHDMYGTKMYTAWANMKKRCKFPTKRDGDNYKLINYCEEWENFIPFMEWANQNGYNEHLSLDRINVHRNYTPENCRWVTMKTQQRNKTNTNWTTYKGETKALSQWEEELGFKTGTLKSRLLRGWTIKRAFEEELGIGRKLALETRLRDNKGRLL